MFAAMAQKKVMQFVLSYKLQLHNIVITALLLIMIHEDKRYITILKKMGYLRQSHNSQ